MVSSSTGINIIVQIHRIFGLNTVKIVNLLSQIVFGVLSECMSGAVVAVLHQAGLAGVTRAASTTVTTVTREMEQGAAEEEGAGVVSCRGVGAAWVQVNRGW